MSRKRFTKNLYDGRIEQLCILSDCERMTSDAEESGQLFARSPTESDDTLSGKRSRNASTSSVARFHESTWMCSRTGHPRKKYSDATVATVAGSCKMRDAFLGFGARLRTELLLHDTRSQPGCERVEETRTEMDRFVIAADAAKLGMAAAPILAVV
ncbi:LOW QUALITY PROTEIN: reverse transcriptase, partial [Phytophthora megakarya]